jgi:hypothetical protein
MGVESGAASIDSGAARGLFTASDLEYLRSTFLTLDQLCVSRSETPADVRRMVAIGHLPRPSYVVDDGTEYYAPDYFALVDAAGGPKGLRAHFRRRYERALERHEGRPSELEDDWRAYMNGVYGICLREVTPENIVEKALRVEAIEELLSSPRPQSEGWGRALRDNVNTLDHLEREFSPDYDRRLSRFSELPSRDRLIAASQERFPAIFNR